MAVPKKHKWWTNRELAILDNFYMCADQEVLLTLLPDRSKIEIQKRAFKRGLRRKRIKTGWRQGRAVYMVETHT